MPKSNSPVSNEPRLDKALFAAGIQCAKRLYQEFHEPESIPKPSESRQAFAEIGQRLTEMACEGFPRGERVSEATHADAVAKTLELLASDSGVAIFDAAFEREGVEITCDIVLPGRQSKEIDIFEVKSGTKVKPRHVMDIALQMWVIEGAGYTVGSSSLLHLDAEYRHDGAKEYPVHRIFKNVDVTKKARKRKRRIPEFIENFKNVLADDSTLELPTGTWCLNPIPCAYLERCKAQAPAHPLIEFPDLSSGQESGLHQLGVETVDQIDPNTPGLTATQRRALLAYSENRVVVDETVREEFDTIVFPMCFVATQLSLQVLPRFDRTRPWQHLPYQWSAHVLTEDGEIEHRSFLIKDAKDPRAEFVNSLLECIDDVGTVVTWSRRLEPALRQIMEDDTGLKEEVKALLQMDPITLDTLILEGAYHPGFRGAFDLPRVYTALTGNPPLNESCAGIRDEESARAAFERLLNSRTRAATRSKLGEELEEYARTRSQMMLEVYRALQAGL